MSLSTEAVELHHRLHADWTASGRPKVHSFMPTTPEEQPLYRELEKAGIIREFTTIKYCFTEAGLDL